MFYQIDARKVYGGQLHIKRGALQGPLLFGQKIRLQRAINCQSGRRSQTKCSANRIGIVRKGELAFAKRTCSSESKHVNDRAGLRGTAHPIVCNALYV